MPYYSGVPYVGDAQPTHLAQLGTLDVVHLPHAVLRKCAPFLTGGLAVAEQTCEDLIYDNLCFHVKKSILIEFRER